MESKPDAEANDEYMIDYVHRGKRLQNIYWTYADNQSRALRAAAATARSDGVTSMTLYRRPKIAPWEQVDWKQHVCHECGRGSGHERMCPDYQ